MGHKVKYNGYSTRVLPMIPKNHVGSPPILPLIKKPLPAGPLRLLAAEEKLGAGTFYLMEFNVLSTRLQSADEQIKFLG